MSTNVVSLGGSDVINISAHHHHVFVFDNISRAYDHPVSMTTASPNADIFVTSSSATQDGAQGVNIELVKFIVWGILGNILAVLGLLGNTLSMVVLHRKQMRSSTSYYLLSLAIYDNCILIGMVLYFCLSALAPYASFMENYVYFKAYTLPFGYPLSLSAQMGSIYTCVGFTVERFIAVCRPLHAANTCTKSRTMRAIMLIFIWSVVYNIPRFFHYTIRYKEDGYVSGNNSFSLAVNNSNSDDIWLKENRLGNMTVSNQSRSISNASFNNVILQYLDSNLTNNLSEAVPDPTNQTSPRQKTTTSTTSTWTLALTEFGLSSTFNHLYLIYFQLFFMFVIPFFVILILNIGLIRAVKSSKNMQHSMCATAKKEHNLTVMLIALIVVFLVCQFPTIIDNIMIAVFGETNLKSNQAYICFWILCTFMVEINAASNFLLYCFFGKKFRLVLLNLLGYKKKHHHVAYRSGFSKSQTNGIRTQEIEVSVM